MDFILLNEENSSRMHFFLTFSTNFLLIITIDWNCYLKKYSISILFYTILKVNKTIQLGYTVLPGIVYERISPYTVQVATATRTK